MRGKINIKKFGDQERVAVEIWSCMNPISTHLNYHRKLNVEVAADV